MKRIQKVILSLFLLSLLFGANLVLADETTKTGLGNAFGDNSPLNSVAKDSYNTTAGEGQLINVIQIGINAVLSILGVIFLIFMIYGGFVWMTAQGNDTRVDKAKSMISAAIVGIVIVVASYAISYFVIANITRDVLK